MRIQSLIYMSTVHPIKNGSQEDKVYVSVEYVSAFFSQLVLLESFSISYDWLEKAGPPNRPFLFLM